MGKIILLSYDYAPKNGGIARMCFEIKKQLELNAKEILVLTVKDDKTDAEGDKNVIRFTKKRFLLELAILFFLVFKTKKDDVILCSTYHPAALLACLSGRKFHILTHGAELLPGNSKFRKYIWLPIYAKWVLSKGTIIANSDFTADLCREIVPNGKVVALPLAVDHNIFRPLSRESNKKIILGSISRIFQFKGYDFVLKVISSMPQEYLQRLEWHIAGSGPYLQQLKNDVQDLNLSEVVKFHGFVDEDKLPNFYNSLDVFLLCTRHIKNSNNVEGFGLVFLEAQSCGTPTIGTKSGGIPSAVIPEKGGWLIEQDNVQQLSDLLLKILDNPWIAKEQGEKGRLRVVEDCTWDAYCKSLVKIIS